MVRHSQVLLAMVLLAMVCRSCLLLAIVCQSQILLAMVCLLQILAMVCRVLAMMCREELLGTMGRGLTTQFLQFRNSMARENVKFPIQTLRLAVSTLSLREHELVCASVFVLQTTVCELIASSLTHDSLPPYVLAMQCTLCMHDGLHLSFFPLYVLAMSRACPSCFVCTVLVATCDGHPVVGFAVFVGKLLCVHCCVDALQVRVASALLNTHILCL